MHKLQAPQKLPLGKVDKTFTLRITKCQSFLIPSQPGLGCLDIIILQTPRGEQLVPQVTGSVGDAPCTI